MEESFLSFFSKIFLVVIVFLLLFSPFVISISERVEALEKLHDKYICLECNSIVEK